MLQVKLGQAELGQAELGQAELGQAELGYVRLGYVYQVGQVEMFVLLIINRQNIESAFF